jgi:hypothetical protein
MRMDPVSNANRIAMMLRARLQERAKAQGAGRAGRSERLGAAEAGTKGAVHSPEAIEGLDDRRLKRAVIEDILTDQFGTALLNDARFQQVIDQVTEAIEADPEGAAIFSRVVEDMRAGAR